MHVTESERSLSRWRRGRPLTVLLSLCAFAACVFYVVTRFQWRAALEVLARVDYVGFVASICVVHLGYIVLRTWRWKTVLNRAHPGLRFLELYWITAIVVSLGNMTPGQFGEAVKIEVLKRRGLVGRLPGIGAFVIERLMDLTIVAAMGAGGLLLGDGLRARFPALIDAIGILLAAIVAVLVVLFRFDPGGRMSRWLDQVRAGSGSPLIWAKMLALSLASWALVGAGWQISLAAVGIHISLVEILWFISLVTLGTLLSLVPGGIGVTEVLAFGSLSTLGIGEVAAQAGAMMLRIYGLVILAFGLGHWALWLLYARAGGGRAAEAGTE
jgi:uncharacterized membrane protein YbhN (UPF0104 family)